MGKFGFLPLALLSLQTLFVNAQDASEADEKVEQPKEIPKLGVKVSTTFPGTEEIFGVKLVNGQPTTAQLTIANDEPDNVLVNYIGGSIWTLSGPGQPPQNVRNLTLSKFNKGIAKNSLEILDYKFTTNLDPQDFTLNLAAVVSNKAGTVFTVQAFNGTVSVVEPEMSIFDPQVLFLYVFILGCFAGAIYFFYTLWIAPYFPQKRPAKTGKPSDRTGKKSADSADQAPESPTVPASAKTYDTEWIPAHHISRPEARKVKSGGGKSKTRG